MPRLPRAGGFTVVEAAVVVAILGILASVGMPNLSTWLLGRKASATANFYAEGLAYARAQAIARNSSSRLVLIDDAATGQMQWRVDFCYRSASVTCDDDSSGWSTTAAVAKDNPFGDGGDKSVWRSAAGLPSDKVVTLTVAPDGADGVYFTPLGWIDTRVTPQVSRITVQPTVPGTGAFKPIGVSLTLAGAVMRCDPAAVAPDRRRCPR